ncbi:fasciclin domain-containing protein [Flagellimonas sp. 389]|uniref:fasciclin domain-containing protein n=1 Tax=Flagellimonas sp. 389 TaxID=2835862 RepID=UPI001BD5BFBB|nr:fasciclin domain-containing protein [Flagellimonas sp. 389]MBS9461815.1 fasciclin domain-containing protein [Flagellimonas sp. 389]
MKKIEIIKFLAFASFTMFLFGCDLDLQERFVFEPDVDLSDPYADITAWEFLNSEPARRLNSEGELSGDGFNYLIAAIEAAGMVEEYNSTNSDRTYLMLNNNAFLGNGNVIDLVTGLGEDDLPEGETPAQIMARADVEVLRLILQYHIITTYITQNDPLIEFNVNYEFQTLIPGEAGKIILRRDDRLRIDVNTSPAPLPSTATGNNNNERLRNYNYVFSNGIGHSINDPVRNEPYPAPNVN